MVNLQPSQEVKGPKLAFNDVAQAKNINMDMIQPLKQSSL